MAERSLKWCKTLGKGEIALYEQVLLFPQCFKKTCNADTYKQGLVWERVKIRSIQKNNFVKEKMLDGNTCTCVYFSTQCL